MRNGLFRKGLVLGIILLFIGINCIPNISSTIGTTHHPSSIVIKDGKNLTRDIKVPDCIEVGDLLLFDIGWDESNRWIRPGPHNEHGAIYVGNNTFVDANPNNVHARNYSHYYNWQKNLVFIRVKTATDSQKKAAVDWAISKIGIPYQNFFWSLGVKTAHTNLPIPYAHKFYCMEFIWAVYYIQGIDIDQNGWKFPWWVTGNDILHDDDIEVIYEEVNDSTEFIKPYKGVYVANNKITPSLNGMNRTYIFGSIDVEVVTYNEMVTSVDFYVDDICKATDTTPPYIWNWNERVYGRKVIKAVACDDAGNRYSSYITVWKFF